MTNLQYREEREKAKIALVTGATGTIGKAIACQIAMHETCEVVLACRNEGKAKQTVRDIIRATDNVKVRYEIVDLSRFSSIRALSERWHGPLNVLVNNACITPRKRVETIEGIELQFATNVLGYFWMIEAFSGLLKASTPSRVVNVASYWAGDLDIEDLEFKRRTYTNGTAYRQSKQADRMLTVAFAEFLKPYGVSVNACHPGDAKSKLSKSLGFGGHESPEQAAKTPVWLAMSHVGYHETGKYFEHMRTINCPFGQNNKAVDELYHTCLSYGGRY